ncbi:hypothetical protein ACIPF8_23330 [Collimonas sp. NPDC087041]|uniref:hypothetical protein n=1 Tax=Collimonas sp. NPDC087041 TaxID=3363960 RepID=UPI003825070A
MEFGAGILGGRAFGGVSETTEVGAATESVGKVDASVKGSLANKFKTDALRPGTALQVGIKPTINLNAADFSPEEIAWINHKYSIAELRILGGAETSEVGAGVDYQYRLSQKFARDTLAPGQPISSVKIGNVAPGKNVDEFVSRQFGGRQVFENQNWAPARANQLMGTLEYNATKDLPVGTPIWGFNIVWH